MKKYVGKVIENYSVYTNDFEYLKGQILIVNDLEEFKDNYAIYTELDKTNILDWIPKKFIQIISE